MKRVVSTVVVVAVCSGVVGVAAWIGRRGPGTPTAKPSVLSSVVDAGSPIQRENSAKGSRAWKLGGIRSTNPVEGFASRTSIAAGETLDVYVRTRAEHFRADVFRMGWYGGDGGRLMQSLTSLPGDRQEQCDLSTDRRRTISCSWKRSFALMTPDTWTSGEYLIKLSATDGTQSWVPFVLREPTPRAPIVFQASVTTWQAYNSWGGRSLYAGPCERRTIVVQDEDEAGPAQSSPQPAPPPRSGSRSPEPNMTIIPSDTPAPLPSETPIPSPSPSASPKPSATPSPRHTYNCGNGSRSRAASFDRPYMWPGDGQFFRFEYPMLFWLESQGLWMGYTTDVDLHEGTSALSSRGVFLSVGHDEYYSTAMRRTLESALAGGTSLAFFGANDMYRHIRFEPSRLGPDRIEVNYKAAAEDPLVRMNKPEVTTQWREWPLNEPEQALLGAQYECNPVRVPWVVTGNPAWLFRETGLKAGDAVPDIVGYEYDRVMPGYPTPPNVVLVADSPLRCGRKSVSNSTFYIAPSGAAVFDAGTLWFPCILGPGGCVNANDPHPKPDARVQRLVRNLIFGMLSKRFA